MWKIDKGGFTEETRKLADAASETGNTLFKILTCTSYLDKILLGFSEVFFW